MVICLTHGDGVGGREGGSWIHRVGGGGGDAKRVGDGRVQSWFCDHELAHRSLCLNCILNKPFSDFQTASALFHTVLDLHYNDTK